MRAQSSNSGDVASAESSNSDSGDDATSIISMIDPSDVKDVVQFLKSSSHHPASMIGCAKANNDTELASLISESDDGDKIRLCPGKVDFYDEIVLDKSITIICAGSGLDACILDGNEATRHSRSNTAGLTLSFLGLVFFNGVTDDSSNDPGFGGSLDFFGSGSTIIIDGSLFYNNHVTSSSFGVVSIIFI